MLQGFRTTVLCLAVEFLWDSHGISWDPQHVLAIQFLHLNFWRWVYGILMGFFFRHTMIIIGMNEAIDGNILSYSIYIYIYYVLMILYPNDNFVSKAINHLMVYTNHLWQIWGWHCRFIDNDWMILNAYDPIYLDYYPTYLDVCPRVCIYIYVCVVDCWMIIPYCCLICIIWTIYSLQISC